VAQRLRDAASQPVLIEGQSVSVGASVGVTLVPGDTPHTADILLRHADAAMYTARPAARHPCLSRGCSARLSHPRPVMRRQVRLALFEDEVAKRLRRR